MKRGPEQPRPPPGVGYVSMVVWARIDITEYVVFGILDALSARLAAPRVNVAAPVHALTQAQIAQTTPLAVLFVSKNMKAWPQVVVTLLATWALTGRYVLAQSANEPQKTADYPTIIVQLKRELLAARTELEKRKPENNTDYLKTISYLRAQLKETQAQLEKTTAALNEAGAELLRVKAELNALKFSQQESGKVFGYDRDVIDAATHGRNGATLEQIKRVDRAMNPEKYITADAIEELKAEVREAADRQKRQKLYPNNPETW